MENPVSTLHSLFLSAWYPNRTDAMSGLFVRKHAEAVSRHCKVSVVYVHADPTLRKNELVIQNFNLVKEVLVYYPGGTKLISRILKPFRFLNAFYRGIRWVVKNEGMPTITHVNVLTRTAIPALYLKLMTGIPYVITEHWTRYLASRNSFHGAIRKWLTRIVVREASLVLPVTKNLQEAMIKHGLKNPNYLVLNNVVEDFFFDTSDTVGSPVNKKQILHISCFDDEAKNISGILRAVKNLSLVRHDFVLTVAGTGKDEQKIKDLFKQLTFPEGMIHFTGELTPSQIADEFRKTDFFLLFSTNENAPVVISESLASGKPVISTNVGGISEMLDSSNSLLIQPRDEKALTEALIYMLDHLGEYDAQKMRAQAYPKYSYEKVGQTIYELYLQVLSRT